MKMTKALTLTWVPPTNSEDVVRSNHERMIQIIAMELDGKTDSYNNAKKLGSYTLQRRWRDQAAVDEYIKFMYSLSNKYGGNVIVGETIDL